MPRRTSARTALLAALAIALAPVLVLAGPAQRADALVVAPPPVAFAPGWLAAAGASTTTVGGAGTAAAAAGVTAGAPVALIGGVIVGGTLTGLAIGDGLVRWYNAGQAEKDQLTPLSQLLIDKFAPADKGTQPAQTPTTGTGLYGWKSGSQRSWTRGTVCGTNYTGTQKAGPPATATLQVDAAPAYGQTGVVKMSWTAPDMGPYTGAVASACSTQGGSGWQTMNLIIRGYNPNRSGEGTNGYVWNSYPDSFNYYGNPNFPSGSDPAGPVNPPGGKAEYTIPSGYTFTSVEMYASACGACTGVTPMAVWYPQGSPSRPADPVPAVQPSALETRATCAGTVVTARSATFDRASATWPAPPSLTCSGALVPSRVQVWEVVPSTGAEKLLTEWNAPGGADPNLTPKPGATLDLQRANPDGKWVSCFSIPGPCAQWYADPNRDTNYRCTYGGTVVAMSQCAVYGPTFDTSSRVPYAGPDGSVPPPSPSNPTGQSPTPVPGQAGAPSASDVDGQRCFPNGWGLLNPVEWVVRPLRCAFEPSEASVRTSTTRVRTAVETGGPGPLIAAVGGVFTAFAGWGAAAGDCRGPAVSWSGHTIITEAFTAYPFDACSGMRQTVASYARTLGTLVIWIAAVVTGTATVARAFGLDLPFTAANEED